MSTHYEQFSLGAVEILKPREWVGDDQIDAGQYGIVLSGNEACYGVGTPDALDQWATSIRQAVDEIVEHAAEPLAMGDFRANEDGNYECPRCDWVGEPGFYGTLHDLMSNVTAHIQGHAHRGGQ